MKEIETQIETLSLDKNINSMIYEIRGQKVMLDFELAKFYGYDTRDFNNQVKHNIEKFDESFMFQLSSEEWKEILRWKISTANLNKMRYLPHAFTEQGIYMLMTVLKGELATKQSILLIKTFKEMKDYIVNNKTLISYKEILKLSNNVNDHSKRLDALENKTKLIFDNFVDESCFKHYLILDGQRIEADLAYQTIYSKAKKTILIVDDYVEIKTLQLMKSSKNNVKISIISDNKAKNKLVENYIKDFEKDTKNKIELRPNNGKFHDRYIVLDLGTINEMIFHCGSSSKDSGNKITAINRIENILNYKDIFN